MIFHFVKMMNMYAYRVSPLLKNVAFKMTAIKSDSQPSPMKEWIDFISLVTDLVTESEVPFLSKELDSYEDD